MQTKLGLVRVPHLMGIGLFSLALGSPFTTFAQEPPADDDAAEAAAPAEDAQAAPAPEVTPITQPSATEPANVPPPTTVSPAPIPAGAAPPPPPAEEVELPPPPAPPAPPPSPFSLSVKGFVAGSLMAQDNPTVGIPGNTTLFGPTDLPTDKWFLGGDVRQSQLKFFITGPTLIGAKPTAGFDFDLLGGHQINSVPGNVVPVTVADGTDTVSVVPNGTSAQGDENILPRVRLAYLELDWNGGEDILRIGQYHHLIVPMIAASLAHIGAPLGYGAGQLGWRAPGITYQHAFKLAEDTNLLASLQVTRNNWADNVPTCTGGATTATANCLPNGVSLAEASMLPQVQARLLLSGPPKASPFPIYAPNAWQVHLVGVWDQKDLSGLGVDPEDGFEDTRNTMIASAGFKVTLGPVLVAGHGWYGKNAGSLFGHVFLMQPPAAGDVAGFGAWGQVGFSITPNLGLWAFAGIDKPDQDDVLDAVGRGFVQNAQLVGMLSYTEGPLAFSLEFMRVMSEYAVATEADPVIAAAQAHQLALTGAFFF